MNSASSTHSTTRRARRPIHTRSIAVIAAMPIVACSWYVSDIATATSPDDTTPAETTNQTPDASAPASSVAVESTMPLSEHVLTAESVEFTFSLPGGWEGDDSGVRTVIDPRSGPVDDRFAAIGLWPGEFYVYSDPCQWEGTVERIGPTVENLAAALEQQAMRDATVTDVEVDGFAGKLVKLSVPADLDLADCFNGEFRSWLYWVQNPGQHQDVYILDVNGTRIVMDVTYHPDLPQAVLDELDSLVQSVSISPVVSDAPATTG